MILFIIQGLSSFQNLNIRNYPLLSSNSGILSANILILLFSLKKENFMNYMKWMLVFLPSSSSSSPSFSSFFFFFFSLLFFLLLLLLLLPLFSLSPISPFPLSLSYLFLYTLFLLHFRPLPFTSSSLSISMDSYLPLHTPLSLSYLYASTSPFSSVLPSISYLLLSSHHASSAFLFVIYYLFSLFLLFVLICLSSLLSEARRYLIGHLTLYYLFGGEE